MRLNLQGHQRPDATLLCLGISVLLIGVAYYVLARTQQPIFLLYLEIGNGGSIPAILVNFPGWIPSYVHAAAFTLLSASWLPPRPSAWCGAAVAWAAINISLEFSQKLTEPIEAIGIPAITGMFNRFAIPGSFDWLDTLAAIGGASTGFVICYAKSSIEHRTRSR